MAVSTDRSLHGAQQFATGRLRQQVRSGTALCCAILLLWLGLLALGVSGFGLAAGTGGQGQFGTGGDGQGYNGSGVGGGGGTGDDPVPQNDATSPETTAGTTDGTGTDASPDEGTSIADLNRRAGEFGDAVARVPDAAPAGGHATPGAGSGSGNEGTEFFGVRSSGRHFVYVVDCSSSMSGPPFDRARQELLDSITKLRSTQKFYVIFFNDGTLCQFHDAGPPKTLIAASSTNKRKVAEWVNTVSASGGTNPETALMWALDLEPSAIYFLTDGQFSPGVVQSVTHANHTQKVAIHTVAFIGRAGEPLLQDLARQNRGKYRFVP